MMDDLISRQAAIESIQNAGKIGKLSCIDILRRLPSAQPEIVMCKDCKHNPQITWFGCPMAGKGTRKPNDFCSYAERRTDE